MTRLAVLIVLLVILVIGASIGYFNAQPVQFNYLFGTSEFPLIAVLIAAFSIGIALTIVAVSGRLFSMRLELRRLRKQLREAEGELRTLRNLPVAPGEIR
ncbi:MAG: LapA family protein [Solimonas sp.]